MTLAMIGITIPTFVTAPMLTLVFGVYGLSIFGHDITLPVGGWNGGAPANMILPVTVLALPQIAIIARLMRGSMVEVLHSNYIRTARAKGLPNTLVVIASCIARGLAAAGQLSGAGASRRCSPARWSWRTIFGLPGIGRYFVKGALNRDYTLVMGVVICLRGADHRAESCSPTCSTPCSIRA